MRSQVSLSLCHHRANPVCRIFSALRHTQPALPLRCDRRTRAGPRHFFFPSEESAANGSHGQSFVNKLGHHTLRHASRPITAAVWSSGNSLTRLPLAGARPNFTYTQRGGA